MQDGAIYRTTTKEKPTKETPSSSTVEPSPASTEAQIQDCGGNSSVQVRSKDLGNWVAGGYQGDLEAGNTYSGILYEERTRHPGSTWANGLQHPIEGEKHKVVVLGSLGASAGIQDEIKKEDWNDYHIIARESPRAHDQWQGDRHRRG